MGQNSRELRHNSDVSGYAPFLRRIKRKKDIRDSGVIWVASSPVGRPCFPSHPSPPTPPAQRQEGGNLIPHGRNSSTSHYPPLPTGAALWDWAVTSEGRPRGSCPSGPECFDSSCFVGDSYFRDFTDQFPENPDTPKGRERTSLFLPG